jgi:hypothetical protein
MFALRTQQILEASLLLALMAETTLLHPLLDGLGDSPAVFSHLCFSVLAFEPALEKSGSHRSTFLDLFMP